MLLCVYYTGIQEGAAFVARYATGDCAITPCAACQAPWSMTFRVDGVIKGWTEALKLMPVGSKWKLTIPSELAYGARGRPNIPAHSVLLFDVELVGIEAEKPAATEGAAK